MIATFIAAGPRRRQELSLMPRHGLPKPANLSAVDAVCFDVARCTVDELVGSMERHGYKPTIRLDLHPDAIWLVGELEQRGLGHLAFVYLPVVGANGVATCWGHPAAALERASKGRTKVDQITAREIAQAMASLRLDPVTARVVEASA